MYLDAIISSDGSKRSHGLSVLKAYEKMLLNEQINKKLWLYFFIIDQYIKSIIWIIISC